MRTLLLGGLLGIALALAASHWIYSTGYDQGAWETGIVACEPTIKERVKP